MSNNSREVLELVLVELTDGQKTKLPLVENPAAFLERTCSDSDRDWETTVGDIPFHSLGKSIVTRTRID